MKKLINLITPKNSFLLLIIVFVVLFITNGVPVIFSDGFASFHTSKTIVDKFNFVSDERPEYIDYRGHTIANFNDSYVVVYAPGSPILNVPGMFIAKVLEDDTKTIYNDYFLGTYGHSLLEGSMYLLTASLTGLFTIVLIYKSLRLLDFSEKISILSTGAVYFSSFAIWYVFLNSAFNHTYELFGYSLLFFGVAVWRNNRSNKATTIQITKQRAKINIFQYGALIAGVGGGIAVLSRPVLITPVIIIGIYFLMNRYWRDLLFYILGGIPLAVLLMLYSFISYGSVITSGYSTVRDESFDFSSFNGLNILFSPFRGWFVYSPIMLIAIVGLVLLYKKDKFLSVLSLSSIFSLVVIFGFWPTWWAGGSYGMRFLVPIVPFAALGIAHLITYLKNRSYKKINLYKLCVALVIVLTLWSLMLTLLYRITPVAELKDASESKDRMSSGDRYTPIDIISYHVDLVRDSHSPPEYFSMLIESLNGGVNYPAFLLGKTNVTIRIDDGSEEGIRFIKLLPEIITDETGEEINLLLYSRELDSYFSIQLLDLSQKDSYLLRFDESRSPISSNHIIVEESSPPDSLHKDDFFGIKSEKYNVDIYFRTDPQIFFRGDPIQLDILDLDYL